MPKGDNSTLPLRFEDVHLSLGGQPVLHALDFELAAGGTTVLLGPNGAGKSLTLRLADGLLAPNRGRIRWHDQDPGASRGARAFVLQRPTLLRRTVEANLRYALEVRRVPQEDWERRIDEALGEVRLEGRRGDPARALSIGLQHRLALARAWVLEPEVLLLDEPAASLDPGGTAALEATITRFAERGTTVWLTTHDLEQARRLADRIQFVHEGRLVEQAPADAFFAEPGTESARRFLDRALV